jgi:hypothetical protein
MAQCYANNYPKLRCSDTGAFSDVTCAPDTHDIGVWHRWVITEAARRTLFMLNMTNWFSCYDLTTGKQSPYYEPLCDDIVFDLPLPCSDAKWLARSEAEWWAAVRSEEVKHVGSTNDFGSFVTVERPRNTLSDALVDMWENSAVQRRGTAQDISDARLGQKIGFSDSEQFRNLIVIAAQHQRPQSSA